MGVVVFVSNPEKARIIFIQNKISFQSVAKFVSTFRQAHCINKKKNGRNIRKLVVIICRYIYFQ